MLVPLELFLIPHALEVFVKLCSLTKTQTDLKDVFFAALKTYRSNSFLSFPTSPTSNAK